MGSVASLRAELIIKSFRDITDEAVASDKKYDLNGDLCAELRIANATPEIAIQGNLIGDVEVKAGYAVCYPLDGSRRIRLNTMSDGTVNIVFDMFGIEHLEGGRIYLMEYEIKNNQKEDRLADARIMFEAGLYSYLINDFYAGADNITADENFLLAESAQKLAYGALNKESQAENFAIYEKFLARAAAQGHGEACERVGYKYWNGVDGYPEDINKAIEFYTKSAEAGYKDGALDLILLLVDEEYGGQDLAKASHWIEYVTKNFELKGEDLGDIQAYRGFILENKGDFNGAIREYQKSIGNNSLYLAEYRLGKLYAEGTKVKKDPQKALELLEKGRYYNQDAQNIYNGLKR